MVRDVWVWYVGAHGGMDAEMHGQMSAKKCVLQLVLSAIQASAKLRVQFNATASKKRKKKNKVQDAAKMKVRGD